MRTLLRTLLCMLAIAGVVISSLAYSIHKQDPSQAPPCAVSEHWDCGVVNHSRFSVFPPSPKPTWDNPNPPVGRSIPVSELGIAGYAVMILLLLWGMDRAFLAVAVMACGFAGFLSYTEDMILHKWCIYCVWSQSVVAAMVLLGIVYVATRSRGWRT